MSEVLVFVAWSRGAGEYLSWHSQGMLTADSSQVPQGRVMIHTGDRQRQVLSTENTDSGGKPLTRDFRSDIVIIVIIFTCIGGTNIGWEGILQLYMRNNLIRTIVTWQTYLEC